MNRQKKHKMHFPLKSVHSVVSKGLKIEAMECLRKKQYLLLLGYGYMRNNLAQLGVIPLSIRGISLPTRSS